MGLGFKPCLCVQFVGSSWGAHLSSRYGSWQPCPFWFWVPWTSRRATCSVRRDTGPCFCRECPCASSRHSSRCGDGRTQVRDQRSDCQMLAPVWHVVEWVGAWGPLSCNWTNLCVVQSQGTRALSSHHCKSMQFSGTVATSQLVRWRVGCGYFVAGHDGIGAARTLEMLAWNAGRGWARMPRLAWMGQVGPAPTNPTEHRVRCGKAGSFSAVTTCTGGEELREASEMPRVPTMLAAGLGRAGAVMWARWYSGLWR